MNNDSSVFGKRMMAVKQSISGEFKEIVVADDTSHDYVVFWKRSKHHDLLPKRPSGWDFTHMQYIWYFLVVILLCKSLEL